LYKSEKSRREFLKNMLKGAGSLYAVPWLAKYAHAIPTTLDPRVRIPNPYVTQDGRPKLICVNGDDFQLMLQTGLAAIGGLDLLINDNQNTLIKPNFVYTEAYPSTSDINSILALIQQIQHISTGTISVGDAGGINNQQIYDFLELEAPITNAGAELLLFEDYYDVRNPSWLPEIPDFQVWSDIYDTPVLLNLCSLKRHYAAYMTCALKHHVGAVAGPNRTGTREYLHSFDDLSEEFITTIAEIARLVNPELTIVDARLIMAINGPILMYEGEIREMNKIVICGDPVAADAYCAQLMARFDETFDPSTMDTILERAVSLGMGTSDLSQVEIIEIEQTSVDDPSDDIRPDKIELYQNYPNPFNASTNIKFSIPEQSRVSVRVFDTLGREVVSLADRVFEAGVHTLRFNANGLPSSVYYAKLTTPTGFTAQKAMVLVK